MRSLPKTKAAFEEYQTPEYHVPHALVLDFDRMLGDVDACVARLYAIAGSFGVVLEEVKLARTQIENDGGSFSPLAYIKGKLAAKTYRQLCQRFVQAESPSVLYGDAIRFLAMLQYSDVPHIVLTYGVDSEWQRLKVAACRYRAGTIILDHTDKGIVMATLQAPDGSYHFSIDEGGDAMYIAESLCLIDDKAAAFKSLPSGCTGILVRRGLVLPSQQGELPPGVRIIQSLDELTISRHGRLVLRTSWDELPPYDLERRRKYPSGVPQLATAVYLPSVVLTE